jgi:hypothetical protein
MIQGISIVIVAGFVARSSSQKQVSGPDQDIVVTLVTFRLAELARIYILSFLLLMMGAACLLFFDANRRFFAHGLTYVELLVSSSVHFCSMRGEASFLCPFLLHAERSLVHSDTS